MQKTSRRDKQTLVQQFMSEVVECGGEIKTRQALYQDLLTDGCSEQCAQYFAFRSPKCEPLPTPTEIPANP